MPGATKSAIERTRLGNEAAIREDMIVCRCAIVVIMSLMPSQAAVEKLPTAGELLDRCGASMNRLGSLIVAGETETDLRRSLALTGPAQPGAVGEGRLYRRFEARSDGRRVGARSFIRKAEIITDQAR